MKKYIFTESQIKRIIDNQVNESVQLNEQTDERDKLKSVQEFLNARLKNIPKFIPLVIDGKTGHNSATESAIMMYQGMIGVYPTDGVWGPNTEAKMPSKEKQYLDKIYKDNYEGPLDWIANKISGWIGN
jgi:peptidoglycan hydrolase-like protein with peptidoglycan-binding domain